MPTQQTVIAVEGLSKRYAIGSAPDDSGGLRSAMARVASAPVRNLQRLRGAVAESQTFWALKDVSFGLPQGEVLGIIGANGAGKSTLLKILARITAPTKGRVRVRGRLASLLEVGTGFHGELTGRENIYFNGAILGMTRRETQRKFDDIVQFAGVEAAVDTPVKRYSSGMFVRLAFAVAAHLDPDILVVDEVLAVGDLDFQNKCMGRMREVSASGRTVIMVSHNMVAVESLCSSCLLLEHGELACHGGVTDVTREYRRRIQGPQTRITAAPDEVNVSRQDNPVFRTVALLDEDGHSTQTRPLGGDFRLLVELDLDKANGGGEVSFRIEDAYGQLMISESTALSRPIRQAECRIPEFPLYPGEYQISLTYAADGVLLDTVEAALGFTIVDADAFGEGHGAIRGICTAPTKWSRLA